MRSYLVTLTPEEPYFFGGERSFKYGAVETTAPNTYYITSQKLPNQTSLLGALRYAILNQNGKLATNGSREAFSPLVGPKSFDLHDPALSFGCIRRLHPLHLRYEGKPYIPVPANHGMTTDGFQFETFCSSLGEETAIPVNYLAKGHGVKEDTFLSLEDGQEVCPISYTVDVGVNLGLLWGQDVEGGFFKKKFCLMEAGWSFGFYADMDETVVKEAFADHVFMGSGKSTFRMEVRPEENRLEEMTCSCLRRITQETQPFWYCLSDLWLREDWKPEGFAIVLARQTRYLTTRPHEKRFSDSMKKSKNLYRLIRAGSVFYYNPEHIACYPNGEILGMNRCIEIKKGMD